MNYAVVWIANGFAPDSPFTTDAFSHEALKGAVRAYRESNVWGRHVPFLVINSVVRDPRGMMTLRDTMLADVRRAGVREEDIVLLPTETTGGTTDGLALAQYAKEHPEVRIMVFGTAPMAVAYFKAMYGAVARRIVGVAPVYEFYATTTNGSLKTRLLYLAMCTVTRVAALTRPTFMIWYNFLNRAYERRKEGFVRTVT